MRLFAIGDTHLSFAPGVEKPMDVFGPEWEDHWQKLYTNWKAKITPDDYVIVCGDLSWGLGIAEAKYDLDWLKAEVANKAGDGAVAYFNANEGKVYCTVNGEAKCDFEV